ncbi:A24 family peptidase [Georgenia sp. H159]|uniref:A24 family peptidase n=1 Tax=Georgenia sp. H159 TaxID=3076115 RepID=UPI002D77689B|nr:A24 family peptidase [Georgenia sp. H159]
MSEPSWAVALGTALVAAAAAWLLTPRVALLVPAGSWAVRSRPHVLLAGAAGLGAGVLADGVAELVAFTAAGVGCALLAVVDLAVRRLPDRLVAGTLLVLLAPLVVAAASGAGWGALGRALLAAVVLVVGYFVLAFISPSGLGLGDVKFAAVVGVFLGWFGWPYVAVGTLLAFVLNAAVAVLVLLSRRGTRESQIPFGPAMMLGATLAVITLGP